MKGLARIQHDAARRVPQAFADGDAALRAILAAQLHQLADDVDRLPIPKARLLGAAIQPFRRNPVEGT